MMDVRDGRAAARDRTDGAPVDETGPATWICCAPMSPATGTRSLSCSAGTATGSGRWRCVRSPTGRRRPTPSRTRCSPRTAPPARFRGDAAVTTWLHRIVVNACLDRIRRRQAHPTVPLPDGVRDGRRGRHRRRRAGRTGTRPRHRAGRPRTRWPHFRSSSEPLSSWWTCRGTRSPRSPGSSAWPRERSRAGAPGAGPGWRSCWGTCGPVSEQPPRRRVRRADGHPRGTREPSGPSDRGRAVPDRMPTRRKREYRGVQRGRPRPARRLPRRRAGRAPRRRPRSLAWSRRTRPGRRPTRRWPQPSAEVRAALATWGEPTPEMPAAISDRILAALDAAAPPESTPDDAAAGGPRDGRRRWTGRRSRADFDRRRAGPRAGPAARWTPTPGPHAAARSGSRPDTSGSAAPPQVPPRRPGRARGCGRVRDRSAASRSAAGR